MVRKLTYNQGFTTLHRSYGQWRRVFGQMLFYAYAWLLVGRIIRWWKMTISWKKMRRGCRGIWLGDTVWGMWCDMVPGRVEGDPPGTQSIFAQSICFTLGKPNHSKLAIPRYSKGGGSMTFNFGLSQANRRSLSL